MRTKVFCRLNPRAELYGPLRKIKKDKLLEDMDRQKKISGGLKCSGLPDPLSTGPYK